MNLEHINMEYKDPVTHITKKHSIQVAPTQNKIIDRTASFLVKPNDMSGAQI